MKLNHCKGTVRYYAEKYEKLFCKNIQVKYEFVKNKSDFAMITQTHYPYEYAIITVYYQELSVFNLLECLIHEYVHVSNFEIDLMFDILDEKTKEIFKCLVERTTISITKTFMELIEPKKEIEILEEEK